MFFNFGGATNLTDPGLVWTNAFDTPPNIATDYTAWVAWKDKRVAQFEIKCPLARTTTYYFAQAGNDTTGDGSQGNPWKTIAKAAAVVAASSGDIRLRFNRGDTWREVGQQIRTDKVGVTIDDYGTGAKPIFTQFTKQYTIGWTLDTGAYRRSETSDIAWLAETNDILGTVRGTHLIRLASAASVQSTPNSWFWDSVGTTLWVNLNGGNPNSVPLEAVISNSISGVAPYGDGSRVSNIVTYGYGCHRTTGATQAEGIKSETSGNDALYVTGCESYFNSSHAMAHYSLSGTGGKAMFKDCAAGYTKYNVSGGETIFNTYANLGTQETWFIDCIVAFGTLKSSDWSYATEVKRGRAFYGHTNGATSIALAVVYNGLIDPSLVTANSMGGFFNVPNTSGNLSDCRAFFVNCNKPSTGTNANDQIETYANNVFYAYKDYSRRINAAPFAFSGGLSSVAENFWFINCYLDIDATNLTSSTGLWNRDAPLDNKYYLWHTMVKFTNVTTTVSFGLDYDTRFNTNALPDATAACRNSNMINSVISYSGSGANLTLSMYNTATALQNNAYHNVTQFANQVRGYNNDAGAVTLSTAPSLGASDALLLGAGTRNILLSHDINGKARTAFTPDIGPEDYSS